MEHKREAIAQLRGMGHSGNKTSSALATPKSTVNRIIREIADRGAVNRRRGSGRPRVAAASEDERIALSVKRDRSVASKESRQSVRKVSVVE